MAAMDSRAIGAHGASSAAARCLGDGGARTAGSLGRVVAQREKPRQTRMRHPIATPLHRIIAFVLTEDPTYTKSRASSTRSARAPYKFNVKKKFHINLM